MGPFLGGGGGGAQISKTPPSSGLNVPPTSISNVVLNLILCRRRFVSELPEKGILNVVV